MRMRHSGVDGRWRFSGKEWQADVAGLPLLDFGARMYDPATASWLAQDPMAERYPHLSPYSYCAGDPVNLIDEDGRRIRPIGQNAFSTILNTLPKDAWHFVKLNSDGYIDNDFLSKYIGNSLNVSNLMGCQRLTSI